MTFIDLRSDTVTRPTAGMRRAIAEADVGDDVFGDDPTVIQLQHGVAERLGKAAGLFVPSGTMSNLVALLTHCQRGDEYIVGQTAHTYRYEAGGAAVLGSIQPQPLPMAANGTLDLEQVAAYIKPDDPHFARSRLLCLENTHGGRPLPLDYSARARQLADDSGLSMHLDGARLFNAAVAQNVSPADLAEAYDSVSICLSKGLGAPVGSVLVGSRGFIEAATRWRKMLGGGMRQAGVIAAAGLYALEHHISRLSLDHERAQNLADGLRAAPAFEVLGVATNMVFCQLRAGDAAELQAFMLARGIRILAGRPTLRLVCHLDVDDAAVSAIVAAACAYQAR